MKLQRLFSTPLLTRELPDAEPINAGLLREVDPGGDYVARLRAESRRSIDFVAARPEHGSAEVSVAFNARFKRT